MIGATLALLLGSSSVLPAAVAVADLPQLFVAACLDGNAKLSPGEASTVGFRGLPDALQDRLGKPSGAQVWRLRSEGQAYLYILNYEPSRNSSPRICGLASETMNYQTA